MGKEESQEVKSIDDQIFELETKIKGVKGTKTEIYSRIVGYYRSVDNWNAGKKHEWGERVLFEIDSNKTRKKVTIETENKEEKENCGKMTNGECGECTDCDKEKNLQVPHEEVKTEYLLFTQERCPNCKPFKDGINMLNVNYSEIDAMENIDLVEKYDIKTTPTLLHIENGVLKDRFVKFESFEMYYSNIEKN